MGKLDAAIVWHQQNPDSASEKQIIDKIGELTPYMSYKIKQLCRACYSLDSTDLENLQKTIRRFIDNPSELQQGENEFITLSYRLLRPLKYHMKVIAILGVVFISIIMFSRTDSNWERFGSVGFAYSIFLSVLSVFIFLKGRKFKWFTLKQRLLCILMFILPVLYVALPIWYFGFVFIVEILAYLTIIGLSIFNEEFTNRKQSYGAGV